MRSLAQKLTLGLVVCLAAVAVAAGSASAKAIYDYHVDLRDAINVGTPLGAITVLRLDTTKGTTLRVVEGGVEQSRKTAPIGSVFIYESQPTIAAGDVIEIYQPSLPAGPPAVSPIETFTIPAAGLTTAPGALAFSGFAPEGSIVDLYFEPTCSGDDRDSLAAITTGGVFSAPVPFPIPAGMRTRMVMYPGAGDYVTYASRIDGETPCLYVDASPEDPSPSEPPSPKPYVLQVSNLRPGAVTDARVVMSRAGGAYFDKTFATSIELYENMAEQAAGGDRVDLYRPAAAGTPSTSFTLPAATAKFDPATNQIAVDTPAARRVSVRVRRHFDNTLARRSAAVVPAGRLLFEMGQPSDGELGIDLRTTDRVIASVTDPSGNVSFNFGGAIGDLLAPTVKLKLSKRVALAKLGKKLKLKFSSTEAGKTTITVALPKSLPSKTRRKPKNSKRLQTIAKLTANAKVGNNTVSLKFSKAGLRALKQLRGVGRGLKPQKLTFTIQVVDVSGNARVASKTSKLVAR